MLHYYREPPPSRHLGLTESPPGLALLHQDDCNIPVLGIATPPTASSRQVKDPRSRGAATGSPPDGAAPP
ncbi:hypothetical protein N7462_009082 [Penicillium macrosclerotiorum]|uniref:uncharacterized protein n=1 Tax=Penicillium macrosclerotiorum TaxID=303699 RepID=UPI002548DF71|nr:uncharacterized protein N7462_009082 [Penicillium macrosclerotiorum]KAJ5676185.1 hypothetical protein N7462_009082 [Penicillium macrosclerotiorum]